MEWYSDVFDLVFPNLDREQANLCKICEWKETQDKKGKKEEPEESD